MTVFQGKLRRALQDLFSARGRRGSFAPSRRAMRLPTACAPPAPKPPTTAAAPTELPTNPVSAPAAAPAPAVVITDPATAASAGAASPPADARCRRDFPDSPCRFLCREIFLQIALSSAESSPPALACSEPVEGVNFSTACRLPERDGRGVQGPGTDSPWHADPGFGVL